LHSYYAFLYTRVQRDLGEVPRDVKTLILGIFVYMIAWGVVDPFLSIFIHGVVKNYSLAGFFYGLFYLMGVFFSMPVGDLAGKVNKVRFIAVSIFSYPLLGVLYFSLVFVPSWLATMLLFFARVLHGVASLFWVMADDFIREKSPKGITSATFGLYFTFIKSAYVFAPLVVVPVVIFFGVGIDDAHWLLLALVPFPVVGALIISRISDRGIPFVQGVEEVVLKDHVVRKEFQDLRQLGFVGFFTLLMGFFMRSIEALIHFLVPLYAFSMGFGLIEISLLFAVINLPYLFSFFFAELADSFGKVNLISLGFVFAALSLFAISFSPDLSLTFFFASFSLGLVLAVLFPAVNGLVTDITPRVNDGEMTGLFKTVIKVGSFVSAAAFGVLAELFGLRFPFLFFGVILLGMAGLTFFMRSRVVVRI